MIARNNKYDLEERTARFGEDIILFCKKISPGLITAPLLHQLVKAATGTGANYAEADDTESKNDFKHKTGICKKESRETKHFLRMLVSAIPEMRKEILPLWKEAKELNLIFNAINNKLKSGKP